jgi:hypothetical protein
MSEQVNEQELVEWTKECSYLPDDQCALVSIADVKRLIASHRALQRELDASCELNQLNGKALTELMNENAELKRQVERSTNRIAVLEQAIKDVHAEFTDVFDRHGLRDARRNLTAWKQTALQEAL